MEFADDGLNVFGLDLVGLGNVFSAECGAGDGVDGSEDADGGVADVDGLVEPSRKIADEVPEKIVLAATGLSRHNADSAGLG